MKNLSKKTSQLATKSLLFFAMLLLGFTGFSEPNAVNSSCPAPYDVKATVNASNSVSFTWKASSGASAYKVSYFRAEDNFASSETVTSNTWISYSNLSAGTYTFYFTTVCGAESSQSIIVDDLIM